MGSNDTPPPHANPLTMPIANLLLQTGGLLWTTCYILLARRSLTTKSYGMPLLALSSNVGWELIYALHLAESPLEQFAFSVFLFVDIFVVYGFLKYGPREWSGSSFMFMRTSKGLASVFLIGVGFFSAVHWALGEWWLDDEMEVRWRKGKWYRGVEGPDMTELAFWGTSGAQAILSVSSLVMLRKRGHSGGVSWMIWITRFLGTLIGFDGYYAWMWYVWPEAHEYFMSAAGIVLWGTALVADLAYGILFIGVRRSERVLADGTRLAGELGGNRSKKVAMKDL